jgi:hypothetical protein
MDIVAEQMTPCSHVELLVLEGKTNGDGVAENNTMLRMRGIPWRDDMSNRINAEVITQWVGMEEHPGGPIHRRKVSLGADNSRTVRWGWKTVTVIGIPRGFTRQKNRKWWCRRGRTVRVIGRPRRLLWQ